MKVFCSIATAALIGLSASASAGEPTRLGDHALDQVTAGFFSGGLASSAFTTGSYLSFGSGGSLFERSFARTTATDDGIEGEASAIVQIDTLGPGPIQASGGAGVLFMTGFNGS